MNGIGLALKGLPIQLQCYQDGTVAFAKLGLFKAIVDQPGDGLQAIITTEDIAIGADTVIEYGMRYRYKEMPELLAYLKSLDMEMPVFN